ncbi:hypothetical protein [Paenibacillus elgii]|uniref:hypothetical protein n=1 Tax=Paenibacillus elgii TaxID=189691 RepID=UPI000FD69811|nr:hypothetical protein [Paenibacillus elgii]NEN81042.1 hypothetical protein [Paenibacillus elgii]
MQAQLIVCDRITPNEQARGHQLGTVLNHRTIPVLPYALDLHILLKIFDLPQGKSIDTHFEVTNDRGERLGKTAMTVLRNYRADDQIPGVDKDFVFTLVLTETGIVHFKCFVDGEEVAWYPLTIRLQEDELQKTSSTG